MIYSLVWKKQQLCFQVSSTLFSPDVTGCHSMWLNRQSAFNRTYIKAGRRLCHGLLVSAVNWMMTWTLIPPVLALPACTGISCLASSNSQPLVSLLSLTVRGRWSFEMELMASANYTHTLPCVPQPLDFVESAVISPQPATDPQQCDGYRSKTFARSPPGQPCLSLSPRLSRAPRRR